MPETKRRQLDAWRKLKMPERRTFWLQCAHEQYTRAGKDPMMMRHHCDDVLKGSHPSDSWDDMIEKDVPRTGVHADFRTSKGKVPLRKVLRAFTRLRPDIGYCQAQSMIAAQLLRIYLYHEDPALSLLLYIADVLLPEYFSDTMRGLVSDLDVFHLLMNDCLPDLYEHLRSLGDCDGSPPLVNAFVSGWQASLFLHVLPPQRLMLVWDCLFADGGEIIIRVALALFMLLKPDLMSIGTSLEFYSSIQLAVKRLNDRDDPLFPSPLLLQTAYSAYPFPFPCLEYIRQRRLESPTHTLSDLGILKSQVSASLRSSSQEATENMSSGGVAVSARENTEDELDLVMVADRRDYQVPEVYVPPDADVSDPTAIWELVNTDEASEAEYGLETEAVAQQQAVYQWFLNETRLSSAHADAQLRFIVTTLPHNLLERCVNRFNRFEVDGADPSEQIQLMMHILRSERIQYLEKMRLEQQRPNKTPARFFHALGRHVIEAHAAKNTPSPPQPQPSSLGAQGSNSPRQPTIFTQVVNALNFNR